VSRPLCLGRNEEWFENERYCKFCLDKLPDEVSHAEMNDKQNFRPARISGPLPHCRTSPVSRVATAVLLCSLMLTTGCLSSLNKRATAVDLATAPVVDQAGAAFNTANSIHNTRVDFDAVSQFDAATPVYNPRNIQPLMSDKDIKVRLAVLAAFQEYVKSVVAITSGTDSPQLQAAAKSAGENLSDVGNALAPSVESALGIASAASTTQTTVTTTSGNTTTTTSSTSSTPAPVISGAVQNGIVTAVDALGQFLINRKTRKELPPIIVSMDPHVKTLCELLESDITILKDQESRDYDFIIDQQTLFIREPSSKLDPEQRREQIMKLPRIVREERASTQQLTQLSAAIASLELAHHALASEAQGNNPQSLKTKLGDLEAAGSDLGNFYSSLATH
jgi:hypothetical protein